MSNYEILEKKTKEFQQEWEKKLESFDETIRDLAKLIDGKESRTYGSNTMEGSEFVKKVKQQFLDSKMTCLSEFMKTYYKEIVEIFVQPDYISDYYTIIDSLNEYPYSRGAWRRTVRSHDYTTWFDPIIFNLLKSYKAFQICHCSISDYLMGNVTEEVKEMTDCYAWSYRINLWDYMLAARLDMGDKKVEEFVEEVLLGDNNTAVVTTDIIRAIVMCHNEKLHQLLADFLLAARLQEGVRQAVCENADCGTISAFLTIFKTIYDNNLIRFAAVKRAVAVWTGLCDEEHVDRITEKVLNIIHEAINGGTEKAIEFTKTNNSIQIMCGLWALGFYDIQNAIDVMNEFITNGTKNQLLTMGYYNTYLYYQEYSYQTAYKVIMAYPQDYELVAVFMPSFLSNASSLVYEATGRVRSNNEEKKYKEIDIAKMYPSREEAYQCYQIMKEIYGQIPKKKKEFSPIIFPWYSAFLSKTDLIIRMCATAYALSDVSLMEEACTYIPEIDVSGYTSRDLYLELLTHDPKSPKLRYYLIQAVADKETYTRKKAFEMVKELQKQGLSEEEYIQLEGFLKYKTSGIRQNVLALLNNQSYEARIESAKRLLNGKTTELRMGGLTILQDLQQDKKAMIQDNVKTVFEEALDTLQQMSKVTDSEQIIVDELLGQGKATEVLNEEGYGLYVPSQEYHTPKREEHPEVFQQYFTVSKNELDKAFEHLEDFYKEHSMLEYKNLGGVEMLLANGLSPISNDTSLPIQDRYPFKELWIEFYETYINNPTLLQHMLLARKGLAYDNIENRDTYENYMKILLGDCLCEYYARLNRQKEYGEYSHYSYINAIDWILRILTNIYPDTQVENVAEEMMNYVVYQVKDDALWYKKIKDKNTYYSSNDVEMSLISSDRINSLFCLSWKTDEEFRKCFEIFYDIDQRFQGNKHKSSGYYYGANRNNNHLDIFDYIKAYTLGIIPKNEVYKAAFEYFNLSYTLSRLSILLLEKWMPSQERLIAQYMENDEIDKESDFYKNAVDICEHIVNKVLDVELSRGDLPTIFSSAATSIKHFHGMERMVQILVAMGDEKLDRGTYYWGSRGDSKSVVLSHLLSECYPSKEDDAKKLKTLLKDKKISDVRLYETIMYAPQWIDIVQEYLKKDLKTGCYYFMAHMNERFDDKKKAVIAKYTPLTEEELNNGAFDSNWFKSAYKTLGEDTFQKLYNAAKYISDGNKHSRARKYSDAALGKVTVEELEEKIKDKRNKDLLMSYGVIPLSGEKDELRRYEFIEGFRKESKQFGAQRKASEGLACDMALRNLATNAGYQDVTRLILAMETKMVENDSAAFKPYMIDEASVCLRVDSYGKVSLECVKKGKTLKSLPANLKNNEYVLYLKDIQKKLKAQYSRTVKMFEQAMEEREVYTFKELKDLTKNPVIEPIITNLVYITCSKKDPKIGLLSKKGLIDYNEEMIPLKGDAKLRVAHPFDLYQAGCWSAYQDYLFTQMQAEIRVKQPFKQVFRELYVKLPEEDERYNSRMFAGNQIQPQKTVGCLKNRRWVADYEEGLQKIYYKDNIIAKIYAMADWFSPSDIEAPTLEWVEFSNRNTFESIKIKDVPDIVYSEVMRDVDLAVSVAHVGGVDPETSHSTMDMRKVIISHNLELFKLTNVTFKDHHAIIKGQRAEYSIHLGSGVIHMIGSHQIYVLPVHSQSRGKIFLPFVDEDPKTAEIMSKIVLFAQDEKIKDPYILDQLK